jgi:hypothetical protein
MNTARRHNMATATKTRRSRTKAVEVDPELNDEVEEEAPAPRSRSKKAPAKKAAPAKAAPKAKAEKTEFGSAWLTEHVNDTLGTEHASTKLRAVLRKLINNGDIDLSREGRYEFTGPRDPNVKALIAALRDEAKAGPSKRGRKPKAAKVLDEAEDVDEEVEDLDLDEDDE